MHAGDSREASGQNKVIGRDSRRDKESRTRAPNWNPALPLSSSVKSAKGLVSKKGWALNMLLCPTLRVGSLRQCRNRGSMGEPRTVSDLGPPSPTPADGVGGRKVQSQSM